MEGLSKNEVKIVAWLEFNKKYFFTSKDIEQFAKNKMQRYNIIKRLLKKKRIVKLNRRKYYLIPIKAKSGFWTEHPFIIVDEACDGQDYMIGGWSAANYWRLTDQIPMRIDIYTTKRQGTLKVLNTKIVFHRTSEKQLEHAVIRKIGDHPFKILNKDGSKKWLKSRS